MNRSTATFGIGTTRTRRSAAIGAGVLGALVTVAAAAPHVVTFEIISGKVIPREPFAAKFTVLGAAIQNGPGGYAMPVTMQIRLKHTDGGTTDIDPFGTYDSPVGANLNPDVTGSPLSGRPLRYRLTGINPADVEIMLRGQSWKLEDDDTSGSVDSDWKKNIERKSWSSDHVKVLRNGDPVPTVDGFLDQASVAYFVRRYVDSDTNTMRLGVNEAIYLFELGTDDTSNPRYDLQDLVVLVTLAENLLELEDQHD